jgi:hypothetical protein
MDRYARWCMLSYRMVRPNPYLTCDHHHRSSPAADRSDLPRTTVSFWGVATRDAGFNLITVGVAETLDDPRIEADPYTVLARRKRRGSLSRSLTRRVATRTIKSRSPTTPPMTASPFKTSQRSSMHAMIPARRSQRSVATTGATLRASPAPGVPGYLEHPRRTPRAILAPLPGVVETAPSWPRSC